MTLPKPLTDLNIEMQNSGFYDGFNKTVAMISKLLIAVLVICCLIDPSGGGDALSKAKNWSFKNLNAYYILSVALFIVTCIVIAVVPSFGRLKLGTGDDKPEFSRFSWFSMMFGAGIGIGMLGMLQVSQLYHFANDPEIIKSKEAIMAAFATSGYTLAEGADLFASYREQVATGSISAIDGIITPNTESAMESAYRYTFLHWGVGAWASYAFIGLTISLLIQEVAKQQQGLST